VDADYGVGQRVIYNLLLFGLNAPKHSHQSDFMADASLSRRGFHGQRFVIKECFVRLQKAVFNK
jgi:hypothetical protein